jgi:hypothetical protein
MNDPPSSENVIDEGQQEDLEGQQDIDDAAGELEFVSVHNFSNNISFNPLEN